MVPSAVSVYVLAAIVRKRLGLEAGLYYSGAPLRSFSEA